MAASFLESHDPRFADLVLFNAELELLADGFRWLEGPVWFGDHQCLLFNDIPSNRTLRWSERHGVSTFLEPSDFANGQARDLQGRLIQCHHRTRCLTRHEHDGTITTLVQEAGGRRLNAPNDVVVRSDGSIWFSDPLYGLLNDYEGGRQESEQAPALYRLEPDSGRVTAVAVDFDGPNGLAFSPDERFLYIADSGFTEDPQAPRHIRRFSVNQAANGLSGGEVLMTCPAGFFDGFRVDEAGRLWTSSAEGILCFAPEGRLIGRIRVPEMVSNLCFGGRLRNRLFICGTTSLYAIYLKING